MSRTKHGVAESLHVVHVENCVSLKLSDREVWSGKEKEQEKNIHYPKGLFI